MYIFAYGFIRDGNLKGPLFCFFHLISGSGLGNVYLVKRVGKCSSILNFCVWYYFFSLMYLRRLLQKQGILLGSEFRWAHQRLWLPYRTHAPYWHRSILEPENQARVIFLLSKSNWSQSPVNSISLNITPLLSPNPCLGSNVFIAH